MDEALAKKLGGTPDYIVQRYVRSIAKQTKGPDGEKWDTIGGEFEMRVMLSPDADVMAAQDALHEFLAAAATRNLKAPMRALLDSEAPGKPIAPAPAPQPVLEAAEYVATPVPAPAPSQATPRAPERILDVGPDDTIQLKVTDNQKKMLLVKVGPFKKFGVTCFPEVAQTWSELDGWGGWQVAQPYFLQSLSISQVVIALKDGDKPDKVVAFR